jgi:hypothetical protein
VYYAGLYNHLSGIASQYTSLNETEENMCIETAKFFSDMIGAGAILTGLCGTFFAFRIQREATFYSQPYCNDEDEWDVVVIDRTHFSAPFFLLSFAFLASLISGLVIPLLGMLGIKNFIVSPGFATGGLFVAIILLGFYIIAELQHYHLFKGNSKNTEEETEEDKRSKDIGCLLVKLAVISISLVALIAFF